jgi:hypothetical protein
MKARQLPPAILSAAMLVAGVNRKIYAQVYSPYPMGYINVPFDSGCNLFNFPLQVNLTNSLSNVLDNELIGNIPVGTSVSLWDPTNLTFSLISVFTNGVWTSNLFLPRGREHC